MNTNILLLHFFEDQEIARISFGENLAKAIEFTAIIIKNSFQLGDHNLIVKDEGTGKILFTSGYRILKED